MQAAPDTLHGEGSAVQPGGLTSVPQGVIIAVEADPHVARRISDRHNRFEDRAHRRGLRQQNVLNRPAVH